MKSEKNQRIVGMACLFFKELFELTEVFEAFTVVPTNVNPR
jgi:hypothetical protein